MICSSAVHPPAYPPRSLLAQVVFVHTFEASSDEVAWGTTDDWWNEGSDKGAPQFA